MSNKNVFQYIVVQGYPVAQRLLKYAMVRGAGSTLSLSCKHYEPEARAGPVEFPEANPIQQGELDINLFLGRFRNVKILGYEDI